MTISADFLAVVITVALIITTVSPVVLIALWIKDWKSNKLW